MPAQPKTIDEYLAAVAPGKRAALQKLRKIIKAAAPKAEECISYGLAAFRLNGRPLVAFGATANHCAFFPMDGTTVAAFKKELKDYETSKGTIRFQPRRPLPAALVRKIVRARIAANDGIAKKPAKASARSDTDGTKTVDAFMKTLRHPLNAVVQAVRKLIMSIQPGIREEVKWNAPSFCLQEFFATAGPHGRDFVRVVLHKGAEAKDNTTKAPKIADPQGILEWHAADRCSVKFHGLDDFNAKAASFKAIVKQWIKQL